MAAILKILRYIRKLNFDIGYQWIVRNYTTKVFLSYDVIDDVTAQRQIRPSIFYVLWTAM